jgi:hypothetical protein
MWRTSPLKTPGGNFAAAIVHSGRRAYPFGPNYCIQVRMLNGLPSNCTYKRGNLYPIYNKPFDLLAEGVQKQNWLGDRDSNPDQMVQSHPSYH